MKGNRGFWHHKSGNISVELALFLPLIVALIFASLDFYKIMTLRAELDATAVRLSHAHFSNGILSPLLSGKIVATQQVFAPGKAEGTIEDSFSPAGLSCAPKNDFREEMKGAFKVPFGKVTVCLMLTEDDLISGFISGPITLRSVHYYPLGIAG
ncbi:MAG: pilus assembly protein [Sneathiella sp.]|nr:pilus assembly protein [Sneathiella sp.]